MKPSSRHDSSPNVLERIHRGLIVSCQARPGEALFGSDIMVRMSKAAESGGAVGIRANTPEDIGAIKKAVALPVIGIYKREYPDSPVYITSTMAEIRAVADAGADIIAIDGTKRPRPGGVVLDSLISDARKTTRALFMADISTLEEGIHAEKIGFDIVATTLAGYTSYSAISGDEPDFELMEHLAAAVRIPVIAEGHINTPQQAAEALRRGCWAVVVGTAITRPHVVTRRFVDALARV